MAILSCSCRAGVLAIHHVKASASLWHDAGPSESNMALSFSEISISALAASDEATVPHDDDGTSFAPGRYALAIPHIS